MIKDTVFIANITEYRNYLQQPHMKYKTPVVTLPIENLLRLLWVHYDNSGNLIYGIEVKR